jgi:hypothetical protein
MVIVVLAAIVKPLCLIVYNAGTTGRKSQGSTPILLLPAQALRDAR